MSDISIRSAHPPDSHLKPFAWHKVYRHLSCGVSQVQRLLRYLLSTPKPSYSSPLAVGKLTLCPSYLELLGTSLGVSLHLSFVISLCLLCQAGHGGTTVLHSHSPCPHHTTNTCAFAFLVSFQIYRRVAEMDGMPLGNSKASLCYSAIL